MATLAIAWAAHQAVGEDSNIVPLLSDQERTPPPETQARVARSLRPARDLPADRGLVLPVAAAASSRNKGAESGSTAAAETQGSPQQSAASAATGTLPTVADLLPIVNAGAAKSPVSRTRVLRRDPVEAPLIDQEAWRELVLSVRLNGQTVSEGGLFVENPQDGSLAAQLALLQALRVRIDDDRIITFQGEPYYPLSAIPGARADLDRQNLGLALSIPADQFTPFSLAQTRPMPPPPVAGTGGFLDYDLLYQVGSDRDQRIDGLVEVGAFGPPGSLVSGLRLDDLTESPSVTRLDTTLSRDFPNRRSTFRAGDSLTVGGAFAAPVRFAGLQYATNFATDPSFVTFPLPTIGGLAEQPSVVDVLVNNLKRSSGSVPPGPFALENVPVVTGAGEVQLRVKDLLGREQLVTQSYYVSPRLLKAGLHDFAYEAGFEREDYGQESFDYGEPLVSATHRYGLTDQVTAETHAELQLDRQSLVGGGSLLVGQYGVISAGVGAGHSEDGPGVLGELAYEYSGRRFNAGARTRYTSDGFEQAGGDSDTIRTDQFNLGLDFRTYGRLGMLLLNRDSRDPDEDVTSVAATYSLSVGPGALMLRAAQLVQPDTELALTALYSLPLGPRRSASTSLERRDGDLRARAQFRQTRGASDLGLDYRLSAETGSDRAAADARFSYQTSRGGADLQLERFDGENNLRAGVNGSVAMTDGKVKLSRRIGRAFGLVALPGFPDVRVYLDNREVGRTDAKGSLLLPNLRPYESNRVRVEVQDLPLDATLASAEVEAVPFERSGMTITFPVARNEQATATLRDPAGKSLPAGLRLKSEDGAVTAWVARDGFTQITGPLAAPVIVLGEEGGAPYRCELPAAAKDEVLPDLGVVTCR